MRKSEVFIPLLAAVVGALATLVGVLATGYQQERADEKAVERAQARELRTASRLLQDELFVVRGHIRDRLTNPGEIPLLEEVPEREEFLPDRTWNQYKDSLAASELSDDQWERFITFYANITGLRRYLRLVERGEPFPPDEFFEANRRLVEIAEELIETLKQLTPEST